MEEQGKEVSALDEKPELNLVEAYYYSAFQYLSIGRPSGMGVSAVSLADIVSFHDVFNSPHDLRTFATIMRSIDAEFLAEARKD